MLLSEKIVRKVADTFTSDNRCSAYDTQEGDDVCLYIPINDKMHFEGCAFAMFCEKPDPKWDKGWNDQGRTTSPGAQELIERLGLEILKEEFRAESYKLPNGDILDPEIFWSKIQELHDMPSYWNEKGLAKDGIERIRKVFGIMLLRMKNAR